MTALLDLAQLEDAVGEHALMSVTDLAGTIVFANDRFCEVSGYPRESLIGRNHRILKSGAHPPDFYHDLWRTARGGVSWHGLICNRRRDGELYWVQSTIKPVTNREGRIRYYLSIRTEVTQQIKLRTGLQALALVEGASPYNEICKALGEATDALSVGIGRCDADRDALQVLGHWSAHAVAPATSFPLADSPLAVTLRTRADSTHVVGHLHDRFPQSTLDPDGRARTFLGAPLREQEGDALGAIFALYSSAPQDRETSEALLVTAATKATAALLRADATRQMQESEARLRTLVDNAPIGVFMTDVDGGVNFVSKQIADRYGRPPEALFGDGWLALLAPAERALASARWRAFITSRGDRFSSEYHLESHDGQLDRLRTLATPIFEDERLLGFVGTIENVSVLRDLEERVRQAHKMEALGAFTGGIAHDFNNILASVLGYAGLARSRLPTLSQATLDEYLGNIEAAGQRGRSLIERLLAFSRSSPETDLRPISPHAIVAESAQLLRAIVPTSIELAVDIEAGSLSIAVDPTELQQALFNLVINARDACGVHGDIRLAVARCACSMLTCSSCASQFSGAYVEVSCSDTGCGIEPQVLRKIFEPFFTTKRDHGGTGLGLAVIHGVVHRGGGHIVVESSQAGGSRFRLLFPAAEPAPASTDAPRHVDAITPRRLLVLDDDRAVTGLLVAILESNGHRVRAFSSPRAALTELVSNTGMYDALITDATMPELTGEELCIALRGAGCTIPIILWSGTVEPYTADRRRELSIHTVLRKPVETATLLAAIEAATAPASDVPSPRT